MRRLGIPLVLAAVAIALFQWLSWPDVSGLAKRDPQSTAFMERYRRTSGAEPDWRQVSYGKISDHLKHAVVVSEDINFFSHRGFDYDEVKAAVRAAKEQGRPLRGASTLSQQLAKNLWLSPSRNPWRKVKEAILTRQLERSLSKRRILELYLNVAEFGPGVYGAEAAARRYFGRSAADLNERQAAELAAALPRPRSWHPTSGSEAARKRAGVIVGRMRKTGWVRALL